jgi:hypothetical protein
LKKILIYRVLIDDYDAVITNDYKIKSKKFVYDFLYITNACIKTSWNVKIVKQMENDASLTNRYYKMCFFDDFDYYDYSIYLDANIRIENDLDELIENLDDRFGIHAHIHPHRSNQKIELAACYLHRKVNLRNYIKERLRQTGLKKLKLFECGVLIKNHKNESLKNGMQEWFEKYKNSRVRRDQIYFTEQMYKNNIEVGEIKNSNLRGENTKYFKIVSPHKKKPVKKNIFFKLDSIIRKTIFFLEEKIN